jgi:hypothetical protein
MVNTRILRHIIIKNNLLSQDKCTKTFSPTQILKKHIAENGASWKDPDGGRTYTLKKR